MSDLDKLIAITIIGIALFTLFLAVIIKSFLIGMLAVAIIILMVSVLITNKEESQ